MRAIKRIKIVVLVVVFMVTLPLSAYAVDGQRKISQTPSTTFPIVINKSGSYVLTSNLVVTDPNLNAIEITVNDVSLDLNGHMIQGPHTGPPWGGAGNGVYAQDQYNIILKNGRIWGFGADGVHLYSDFQDPSFAGSGHQILRIQAANNGQYGIQAYGCLITNCTANNNNTSGILGNHSTVTNCIANRNLIYGISFGGSTIINCTATNNNTGISCTGCTITNCTAINNETGFYGQGSTITNCSSEGNDLGFGLNHSILTNSSATDNSGDGIGLGQRNRIEGNNVIMNGGYGIHLAGGTLGALHNYVIKNTGSSNTSGNFQNDGGYSYMPICGVDATDNCNYGF